MKFYFTILILISSSIIIFGLPSHDYPKLIRQYTKSKVGIDTLKISYTNNGLKESEIKIENGKIFKTYYFYDSLGRVIQEKYIRNDNDTSDKYYNYNRNGKVVLEKYKNKTNPIYMEYNYTPFKRTVKKYEKDNVLYSLANTMFDKNQNEIYSEYFYSEKRLGPKRFGKVPLDLNNKEVSLNSSMFDSTGKYLLYGFDHYHGNSGQVARVTEYEYSKKGKLLKTSYYELGETKLIVKPILKNDGYIIDLSVDVKTCLKPDKKLITNLFYYDQNGLLIRSEQIANKPNYGEFIITFEYCK